jgi:hypothetical protein
MALTETQKVQIISRIGVSANFSNGYSQDNRNWFARHMIEHYTTSGVADANIESTVLTFVQNCKTIANAKKNFSIGVTFSSTVLRTTLSRRLQIIYGALAAKPDLALASNASFLDFILKRRFRSVMRMDYFVNPNRQGYFRYPSTCHTAVGNQYKVNDDATSFWVAFHGGWNGAFFRLTPPPPVGPPVGPVLSIEKIFISKSNPCQGNLLDCARVLSIVYMDSLFEAVNKDALLNYLAAKPDTHIPVSGGLTSHNSHIGICHVNDVANSHFITDTSAESLFAKPEVPANDLQVGDHVYIFNHPLYKVFNQNGSWRGEHALVYNLGNRNYRSQSGFKFGGHGKEGTLYQFYSAFMQELKTHLERVYKIAKIHLQFRQTGPVSDGINFLSSGSVDVQTTSTGWKIFEYDVPFTYIDYEHGGRRISSSKFLVGHEAGFPHTFWIDKETTAAALFANGRSKEPVIFDRIAGAPAASTDVIGYDPQNYSIRYSSHNGSVTEFYRLFDFSTGALRLKQITMADLFNDPFSVVPGTSNLNTTQPKVDTSSTYISHLRTHGAIS